MNQSHFIIFTFIFQVLPTSSHQVFCVVGKSKGEGPTAHGIFRIGVRYLSDASYNAKCDVKFHSKYCTPRMSNISQVHAWLMLSQRDWIHNQYIALWLGAFSLSTVESPAQCDCRIMNITNKIHKSKSIVDIRLSTVPPVLVGPPAISSKTRQALMLPVRQLIIKGVRPSPQRSGDMPS